VEAREGMSEGLRAFVASILEALFLISGVSGFMVGAIMWNAMRKRRRSTFHTFHPLGIADQPPENKAYFYSFVLLWLVALVSILLLNQLN
jgi:hypothetical protein